MRLRAFAFICVAFACVPTLAFSQARSLFSNLANPAIGLNGLFSIQADPDVDVPYGPHFDSAELSLISVVDPYWTFQANITFTGEEVDPEEVWVQTISIPSVALRGGKIRAKFGRQGQLHTHAFPFVYAPVISANTIGEEGFKDAGWEAGWLTPAPWFMELTGAMYYAQEASDESPLDFGSTAHGNIPFGGRLANLFDLTANTTMEFGFSGLSGEGENGDRNSALGADLTLRNVPARASNRRGWILTGEYIEKGTTVDGKFNKQQHGWFASIQYRLSQTWWVGLRGEQAYDSYFDVLIDPTTGDAITGDVNRVSANIAWTPSEFSYVRLEYDYAKADGGNGFEPDDNRVMIEMSYTIGYHPAHAY
jgi:hypothetical protein